VDRVPFMLCLPASAGPWPPHDYRSTSSVRLGVMVGDVTSLVRYPCYRERKIASFSEMPASEVSRDGKAAGTDRLVSGGLSGSSVCSDTRQGRRSSVACTETIYPRKMSTE
jgi:hypothetical protein